MRPYFTPDGWAGGELRQLEGLDRLVVGFNWFCLSFISFKTFISFHGRTLCHCDVGVFGGEILSPPLRLDVRYSAKELSKADIVTIVYGGYNSTNDFDSSRVYSAVD